MSRRKDRERVLLRKKFDPSYKGFRGYEKAPPSKPELKSVICSVCGRKRNVALDTPEEEFICISCRSNNKV